MRDFASWFEPINRQAEFVAGFTRKTEGTRRRILRPHWESTDGANSAGGNSELDAAREKIDSILGRLRRIELAYSIGCLNNLSEHLWESDRELLRDAFVAKY